MAIYHLGAKIVTRAKGQSAIACAAYRAAEKLNDERQGVVYDYTKKQDVVYNEILLPEGAPAWMENREKLWNAVELVERRKDAQLAREVQVSLPRELTLSQNIALTREFVTNQFIVCGMVADFNIHVDKASDGCPQPHAHIMLTMREVTEDGFGKKVRAWNDKENLQEWRQQWAEYTNKHLALNGHDLTIDHRSLEEQGIELEPQKKIGASSAYHRMAAYRDHQEIVSRNGERLLEQPEIVLDVLTSQQSTFTHQDIARIVNRYTADVSQFQSVYEKVKALPELVQLGFDDKNRQRFTTQSMLKLESEMAGNAVALAERQTHAIDGVSMSVVAGNHGLSQEQRLVLNHLVTGGDLRNVIGYAGTGKSRILGAAREVWENAGYKVHGASLAGIAAENLEASSDIPSRTLASRFYYWDRGLELLGPKDVLVIDEAGMLGSRQLGAALEEANKRGAKVVLIGDPEQLQAIGAGAAFRAVAEKIPPVELTEIWRQKADWQKDATIQFATQQSEAALTQYDLHDCLHQFDTKAQAKEAMVDAWNDVRIANPDKSQIMLAYTRADAFDLNVKARALRQSLGELGKDHEIVTQKGIRVLAEGDRIYFLKNDRDLGVKNGTLGTVISIQDADRNNRLSIQLDKEANSSPITVNFSLDRYKDLDYGYAATIHKGQGVTVDCSYILASRYLDRHATYVAMTRHKVTAELFWSKEEFPTYKNLVTCLSRERSKDSTLDYSAEKEFAKNRGIRGDDGISIFSPNSNINDPNTKQSERDNSVWQTANINYAKTLQLEKSDVIKVEKNSGSSFKVPEGYEDLFTPDIVKKINTANKQDLSGLFIGNDSYKPSPDIAKSKDDKEIEL